MQQWFYYTNVFYKYTHGSFNIDNEVYCYFKNNNNNCRAQKSRLIPKVKCTIFLEQLYYMYYKTRPKSASQREFRNALSPNMSV
jgi:hypothetical protein